mgnify:CR=1 FL=1
MGMKDVFKRYLVFVIGLYFLAAGIVLIVRSALGTTPISSINYVLSLNSPLSLGTCTFLINMLLILGKYNNCDGIVIDTRFNGGGRLHEDIGILFSGQKYFTQVVRGREACDMPSRRWNKPSIMLQCEANYSNAHGTPWVYKHQNIGKLVGMPVPGTMTSVSWETLQDPSLVFGIPIIGYRLPDGSYLENTQLEPDIKVANSPETVVKGEDTQLKMAVDELLKEIDSRKK